MSTRSVIIVKVPKELIGTEIAFDATKLPVKVGKMNYDTNVVTEQAPAKRKPIKIAHEYLRIFHHWDGYPTSLGAYLLDNYNSFEAALNLVAGGHCDSCIDHYMGWAEYGWTPSKWDWRMQITQSDAPMPDEEYSYMWADGKWWYFNYGYDHFKAPHDLRQAVRRAIKKEQEATL